MSESLPSTRGGSYPQTLPISFLKIRCCSASCTIKPRNSGVTLSTMSYYSPFCWCTNCMRIHCVGQLMQMMGKLRSCHRVVNQLVIEITRRCHRYGTISTELPWNDNVLTCNRVGTLAEVTTRNLAVVLQMNSMSQYMYGLVHNSLCVFCSDWSWVLVPASIISGHNPLEWSWVNFMWYSYRDSTYPGVWRYSFRLQPYQDAQCNNYLITWICCNRVDEIA